MASLRSEEVAVYWLWPCTSLDKLLSSFKFGGKACAELCASTALLFDVGRDFGASLAWHAGAATSTLFFPQHPLHCTCNIAVNMRACSECSHMANNS